MRRVSVILYVMLLSLQIEAQNVSSSEAFEIAQRFMAKKGITLVNDDKVATRGNAEPYSIFKGEDNKGFAIVVNGSIVGYSTENGVGENGIPDALKGMLGSYSKASTRNGTEPNDYPPYFEERDVTPIEPLITTRWNQCSPYNDLMEQKINICATVAWAQVIHYFKFPQTYCDLIDSEWNDDYGYVPNGVVFPITTFDNSKILDDYCGVNYTEEEAEEVAKLFQYTYFSAKWGMYGDELLEMVWNVDRIQIEGYDLPSQYAKFDELLEWKIPIIQGGANHLYVMDGRDSKGLYHVNFGWGGYYDGYYVFPDCGTLYDEYPNDYTFGSSGVCYILPKGWTSSINGITKNKAADGSVYNLQGQKVSNSLEGLSMGIYIKNGKKHVVK